MTKIMPCICKHEFQDRTYGMGKRVHNSTLANDRGREAWRCTVCGVKKEERR